MKHLVFSLAFAASLPAMAQTPDDVTPPTPNGGTPPTPSAAPTQFDWRLRLTKGQTWTEIVTVKLHQVQQLPTPGGSSKMELDSTQSFAYKNVVLDVNPTYYLVRGTYTRFSLSSGTKINGQKQPQPPFSSPNIVGASFTLKMAPDGRILDVTDLEDIVKRSPVLGTADSLKRSIKSSRGVVLPKVPLGVGDSYTYTVFIPGGSIPIPKASLKGTLLSFDASKAQLSQTGTLTLAPTEIGGAMVSPQVKTFITMNGTAQGNSTIDAQSGLQLDARIDIAYTGRVTVADKSGRKHVSPLTGSTTTFLRHE